MSILNNESINIIKYISEKYDIDNKKLLNEIEIYLTELEQKSRCRGITSKNTRCTRKAWGNTGYCKIHQPFKTSVNNPSKVSVFTEDKINVDKAYESVFIQSKQYYIDSKYIYDVCGVRVGYISGTLIGEDCKYIFEDDPFLLDSI